MFPSGGLARFELSNAVTQQAGAWTIEFGVGYDALWADGSYAQTVLNLTNVSMRMRYARCCVSR